MEKEKQNTLLGKGWAFPPRFLMETNETAMVEGLEDINQSLYILFTTEIGERVMQANYGSALRTMLFEEMNAHFQTYMRLVLSRSIALYEPRIRPIALDFRADEILAGRFILQLDYVVIETQQKNNYIFPFYLNP